MKYDSFHFASMLETSTGTLGLRGRPDRFDPDAFGSTLQRNVFMAGPGVDAEGGQIIEATPTEAGIRVRAEGTVASTQGNAGTFAWSDFYTYAFDRQEIVGEGTTSVYLDQVLTGEMNVSRVASNFLHDHPLNNGEVGDTGDMSSVTFEYGPDSPVQQLTWTPAPGLEGFFPTDKSSSVTTTVHGEINRSDPNRFAIRKPTVEHRTVSTDEATKLIQGGFWDSQAVGFQFDNVGVSQIVKPENTAATVFEFTTRTAWTPPDTATMSVADAAVEEADTTSTTMNFPVTLVGAVSAAFDVDWSLTTGSGDDAQPGVDYVMDSGTIGFAGNAGEVQQINVTILGDENPEPDETFTLVLDSVGTAEVRFTDNEATGLIRDNDEAPDITPPSGSMQIEGGAAVTNQRYVTLNLNFRDEGSGLSEMRARQASNRPWTDWQPYDDVFADFDNGGPDGTRWVIVQVRDRAGNVGAAYDSIVLDSNIAAAIETVFAESSLNDRTARRIGRIWGG